MPSINSIGKAKITVLDGSGFIFSIVCNVLIEMPPGAALRTLAACASFSAAVNSPSALMMTARLSLSDSACFAIIRFMSAGSSMS